MHGSPDEATTPQEAVHQLRVELERLRNESTELRTALDRARDELAQVTREAAGAVLGGAEPSNSEQHAVPAINPVTRLIVWLRSQSARTEWLPRRPLTADLIAITLILLIAIAARYYNLTSSPDGIQGDEAAVALEARHILNDGWIGYYSPAAAGTPTGYYILAAPFVAIWGDTILAVRLLSATLGTLTVLAFYVLLRRNLGLPSAVFGSLFLAVFGWHLIFSRISFLTISWPFVAILGLVFLFEGMRSRRWEWWFLAGIILALGMYTYNGHSLFVLLLGSFIALSLFGWRASFVLGGAAALYLLPGPITAVAAVLGLLILLTAPQIRIRERLEAAAGFGVGFGIAFFPMGRWILDNQNTYLDRGRRMSLFRDERWTSLTGVTEKAEFLVVRYGDFWKRLTFEPRPDYVDTSGIVPIVPESMLYLAAVGAILALIVRNTPLTRLGLLVVLVMPIASMAFADLAVRRSLIMAPFLAMFCGLAIVELIRRTWGRSLLIRYGVVIGLVAWTGLIGWRNLDGYFVGTNQSPATQWIVGPELVETANYLKDLPDDSYIYFASNRWPIDMEIIRFLAPGIHGETRFEPYGEETTAIDPTKGTPVWILMGPNLERLDEIQQLYPGGTTVVSNFTSGPQEAPAYIAYFPPAATTP